MNYEAKRVLNQRGAVLIFSLLMLLLLTLVSVSMIQQNKQELAMAGNALDQTASLASAETELGLAENLINTTRTTGAPASPPGSPPKCNASNTPQANVSSTPFFTGTGNATITAVYCLIGGITERQCMSGVINDNTVTTDALGVNLACQCAALNNTEIYVIRWVSWAISNYGSQRVIESKYAVNCSGGTF